MWKTQSGKTIDGEEQRIHYNEARYRIDLRMMCSKRRSIRYYKTLYNAVSQNSESKIEYSNGISVGVLRG